MKNFNAFSFFPNILSRAFTLSYSFFLFEKRKNMQNTWSSIYSIFKIIHRMKSIKNNFLMENRNIKKCGCTLYKTYIYEKRLFTICNNNLKSAKNTATQNPDIYEKKILHKLNNKCENLFGRLNYSLFLLYNNNFWANKSNKEEIKRQEFIKNQSRSVGTSYKMQLKLLQWENLKNEMINFFREQPPRDSTINIEAKIWPKYASKEQIYAEGYVPCIISKYGVLRKICINRKNIEAIAFDEPDAHLSLLFTGRLFRVHVGKWIEECVVSHVSSDPVEKHLYFIRFCRHVSGMITELEIPVTIVGMLACPAYIKGYHVEMAMPTIRCEIIGQNIPPPFQVDVSKLKFREPYAAITLADIRHLLPDDGTVRFHRKFHLNFQEVIWTYEVSKLVEQPLPDDWQDENFLNKKGRRIHLTFKGYFPKQ